MGEVKAAPTEYKDRRTALIVFGVWDIFLGLMSGVFALFMVLGVVLTQAMPESQQVPVRHIVPGLVMYVAIAVVLIWLGIGSIKCRRWARALMLIFSWFWLIAGIAGLVGTVFAMPMIQATTRPSGSAELPESVRMGIMVFTLLVCSVIYVVIPGVLVLFYRGANVKATCEARDPVTRWTDRSPLPLLGLTMMLGFSALAMPVMLLCFNVFPFFGFYVDGLLAAAIGLVIMACYAFAAHACYQQRIMGWWIALASWAFWFASSVTTFASAGIITMYQKMGYPEAYIERLKPVLHEPTVIALTVASSIPFLAFLIYTRRFFKK
jgi:hypothetical protein